MFDRVSSVNVFSCVERECLLVCRALVFARVSSVSVLSCVER